MKLAKKIFLRLKETVQKNLILAVFIAIVLFVGLVVVFKFFTAKGETVYVKIKVSQGLWWANTLKPSYWLADAIHKGDSEVNLAGKPNVEVLEVRKYPLVISNYNSEQYDVFLTVKLNANFNERTQKYSFKRADILIGAPIEFELKNAAITGTVIGFSNKPFQNQYEEKIVTLLKESAQEWEYDAILEGDVYSDGVDVVVEVLDKNITDTFETIEAYQANNSFGNTYPIVSRKRVNITVTVKMKLKKQGNTYFFREELPISLGRRVNLSLNHFVLNEFVVASIK